LSASHEYIITATPSLSTDGSAGSEKSASWRSSLLCIPYYIESLYRMLKKKERKNRKTGTTARRRPALYEVLTRITEAVNDSQSLQELFRAIHTIVAELMPAKNFYIAICEKDEKGNEFVTFPFFQDEIDEAPQGRVPLRKSFTGYVIRTGIPLLADDKIGRQLLHAGEIEEFMGTDSAIWLGVPLKTKGQTVGAVVVQSYDRQDEYGEKEKQILSFISSQIAIAIELTRYREKLEDLVHQRTNELFEEKKIQEILFEISQAVYHSSNLRDFLVMVQEKISQLMDAKNFYVALHDPMTGKYHFPYFVDEFDSSDSHSPEDLSRTLTDYVRQKGPLLANHAVHQRLIKEGEVSGIVGTDSLVWLGVPLLVPGKIRPSAS
jgi:transcriptional regulator with GAF, ATPase, and Fis domain